MSHALKRVTMVEHLSAPDEGVVPRFNFTGQTGELRHNWPFYWVSRVNARYIHVLERKLKPLGLDIPRWRVLISLYEDKHMSVSEIAEISVMKLNTATKVVQRLVSDGMVSTRVRPSDGRVTEVQLTERGTALRHAGLVEAERILIAAFSDVSTEELSSLNQILSKVLNRLVEL